MSMVSLSVTSLDRHNSSTTCNNHSVGGGGGAGVRGHTASLSRSGRETRLNVISAQQWLLSHFSQLKSSFFLFLNSRRLTFINSYPRPEPQQELSLLVRIQQLGDHLRHGADKLLHHAVVLDAAPLHHVPHGRRHQAEGRNEEAESRQQERRVCGGGRGE